MDFSKFENNVNWLQRIQYELAAEAGKLYGLYLCV